MRFDIFRACLRSPGDAGSVQMIVQGKARRLFRVRLGVAHLGQTAGYHSPMIEDARDVPDLVCLQAFDATKGEIVVLRSLQTFTKATNRAEQRSPVRAEMINIVLPEKQLRVPIGFEERIG